MTNRESASSHLSKRARMARSGFAILAAGMLFSSSCSSTGINALIAGIDAAASALNNSLDDDSLSFGEWLLSELD